MDYLAFALKYRPKNFEEVVGQKHVVSSLTNAIIQKRVHHAYLFSGPRGVGKTSMARILAKALNCQKGPTPKPCGTCPSCASIAKGNSLDLIEIDGASNRGIDEIRTLRENVKLSPAGSLFKIYIIDEVHMLTQEAFNALLKTLEEPPAHVKFIFATTHPHKVPPTILSRCQKFQFSLFGLEEIVVKLQKIIKAEKIKIKDSLLYTIGRAAGGSIRDAESLLDQLVPIILEKGSLDDIFSFLGIIDESSLNKILQFAVDKELELLLSFIDDIFNEGKDLGAFVNAFIEHLRNLLLAKVSPKTFSDLSDVSPASKDLIAGLSEKIETGEILELIDLLLKAKDISVRLNTVRIPLELALIKFILKNEDLQVTKSSTQAARPQTDKPQTAKTEEVKPVPKKNLNAGKKIEIKDTDLDTGSEKMAKPAAKMTESKKDLDKAIDEIALDSDEPVVENKEQESKNEVEFMDESPADDILLAAIKLKWKEALNHMHKTRAAISSHLLFAQAVSSRGNVVAIAFNPGDCFHKEIVEGVKNTRFIENVFSKLTNKTVGVKFILKDLPAGEASKIIDQESEDDTPARLGDDAGGDDEFLNELLDTFGGKFHSED